MRRTAALALCLLALPAYARLTGERRYDIPSGAMEPTLMRGDKIGCSGTVPERLARGMVVVFKGADAWSPRTDVKFVKRVVGLPGDTVSSEDGKAVLVNGTALPEPYLSGSDDATPFEEVTVPEGAYFVLGDNRDGSSDSRFNGPVRHGLVEAVCTRIVAPADRKGRIAGT